MGLATVADRTDEWCEQDSFNPATVARLRPLLNEAAGLAALFKALADETRVKIAYALLHDELCVHDVAALLHVSVATASHHLRLLRQSGLAKSRRDGKFVFYSLDDDHVRNIVGQALEHVQEGRTP